MQNAIKLTDTEIHGRKLRVSAKRTNVPGMKQGGRGRGGRGGRGFNPYGMMMMPMMMPHMFGGRGKGQRSRRPRRTRRPRCAVLNEVGRDEDEKKTCFALPDAPLLVFKEDVN